MCVTIMVFSVCVNDTVNLLKLYLKAACDGLWFIMTLSLPSCFCWLSVCYKGTKQILVLEYFYILNIILTVNEIMVFKCKFRLNP